MSSSFFSIKGKHFDFLQKKDWDVITLLSTEFHVRIMTTIENNISQEDMNLKRIFILVMMSFTEFGEIVAISAWKSILGVLGENSSIKYHWSLWKKN